MVTEYNICKQRSLGYCNEEFKDIAEYCMPKIREKSIDLWAIITGGVNTKRALSELTGMKKVSASGYECRHFIQQMFRENVNYVEAVAIELQECQILIILFTLSVIFFLIKSLCLLCRCRFGAWAKMKNWFKSKCQANRKHKSKIRRHSMLYKQYVIAVGDANRALAIRNLEFLIYSCGHRVPIAYGFHNTPGQAVGEFFKQKQKQMQKRERSKLQRLKESIMRWAFRSI